MMVISDFGGLVYVPFSHLPFVTSSSLKTPRNKTKWLGLFRSLGWGAGWQDQRSVAVGELSPGPCSRGASSRLCERKQILPPHLTLPPGAAPGLLHGLGPYLTPLPQAFPSV